VQISSILDIVDGSLLNSPSISFIYSIKTNSHKVKEGDLFIAKNTNEIELAIKNGAFAIIIDTNASITSFYYTFLTYLSIYHKISMFKITQKIFYFTQNITISFSNSENNIIIRKFCCVINLFVTIL